MAQYITAPRGTQDVLPVNSYKWQYIEEIARKTAEVFGHKEIRFPTFEHTELFCRGVGDTSDVVQKEMYTFEDKGNRSITLRPEGTASTVRAVLEHGLLGGALPLKAFYLTSCFRYEKPQAGRLREFHQFGMECFGSENPIADAEMISSADYFFKQLGISNLRVEINSIGCPVCRKNYHEALKSYFESKKDMLCGTCNDRLNKNPMRILDCKCPECQKIAKDAPHVLDFLCDECSTHFEKVKEYLNVMGIDYKVNPTIVRGLDYYTKTVFEFVSENIGAQGTVCGGGRYDGLVETLGGNKTAALGYAIGLERVLLLMDAVGAEIPDTQKCDLYVAAIGENAFKKAIELIKKGRDADLVCEMDLMGRGVKSQMKYANKIDAQYSLVIGDDEIENKKAKLKNMQSGGETEISIDENFVTELFDIMVGGSYDSILKSFEALSGMEE
ncbi:MAG: histidine--tRNA ligase [Oscillospiraceae bacterium]|nr:histidine--tRNA ligase [Oscillospiraceae bacterium]